MKYLFKIITTLITVLVLMKISAGVSFAKSNCDGLDYLNYSTTGFGAHPAISANDEDICLMQGISIYWQCESEKRGLSCNVKDSNIHNKTSLNNSTDKLPNRCSTFKYSFYGYTKKLVTKSTDSKVCRFSINPKQTGWDKVINNCAFIIESINRNFSVRDCLNILKSETEVNKSDVSICNLATDYGRWTSIGFRKEFIEEAKRRGLTCGVITDKPISNFSEISNTRICEQAIYKDKWRKGAFYSGYVKEAKRRGLTCSAFVNLNKLFNSLSDVRICEQAFNNGNWRKAAYYSGYVN